MCAYTVSHLHYPLPRAKLASLVKGEVLSPEKIRATTGGIAAPPSLAPHQPFQKPTLSLSLFVGEGLAPPVAPNTATLTTIAKGQ